ncbi:TetR/AcrR family transcriptional regulator [Humibacter ginsenosidimutans]|uniref:TetR/AcrR family transcriptional regulator n=1 Tax=Humibacter ginsenosidimutans TaxID=2599293 RepID=A0A5B8M440_9MICO|nr:TetR/AcrR family transcriptional regulator [Humibacter ginsenosidimutans]QDZ14729.1 TetR/AcrR family transcriptional regulator [Humibacter ginsenosidimutans]
MPTTEKAYHHGDLRAALLAAAIESLEAGETPSMRAVARRAGVSPAAPYRHFADRDALDSALAVRGFDDLHADLAAALEQLPASASPQETLGALAVAYVDFALRRPALFHLMFGNECDDADSERVRASGQLHALLGDVVAHLFPTADGRALSLALWSLAHGLAFLHLDGKLRPEPTDEVEMRVRAAIITILALNQGEST